MMVRTVRGVNLGMRFTEQPEVTRFWNGVRMLCLRLRVVSLPFLLALSCTCREGWPG